MVVFAILGPDLRPLSGIDTFFFHQIYISPAVFWGHIYRELLCSGNHFMIISGSRSKVEKTTKNFVSSTFDCHLELIMKNATCV